MEKNLEFILELDYLKKRFNNGVSPQRENGSLKTKYRIKFFFFFSLENKKQFLIYFFVLFENFLYTFLNGNKLSNLTSDFLHYFNFGFENNFFIFQLFSK